MLCNLTIIKDAKNHNLLYFEKKNILHSIIYNHPIQLTTI